MTDSPDERKLREQLKAALEALRDLTSNLELGEECGPYGRYYVYKWHGDSYLVDAAVSVMEMLEAENEKDETQCKH